MVRSVSWYQGYCDTSDQGTEEEELPGTVGGGGRLLSLNLLDIEDI